MTTKKQKYYLYVDNVPVDGGDKIDKNSFYRVDYGGVDVNVFLGPNPREGELVARFSCGVDETPFFCGGSQLGGMYLELCKFKPPKQALDKLVEGVQKSLEGIGSGNYVTYSRSSDNSLNRLLLEFGFKKTAEFISHHTRNKVIQWNYVPDKNQILKKKPSSAKPRRPSSPAKRATR